MKTVLFVCGDKPLKKTLLMPCMSRLTRDVVNASPMCGEPLPPLPRGYFDFVVSTESCQVFVFKHNHTTGCSNTESPQHSSLPSPKANHKSWENITEEPKVHVGCSYMFGHNQPYRISNSKVLIGDPVIVLDKFDMAGNARTTDMISELNSQVAKSLKPLIKKFGENAGEKIRVMTCYGISLGGLYPLNILKLTVDFDNQLCKYEEQLTMYPSAVYAAYIDIGISYILKRLC